jgi:hypothetical protein
MRLSVRQSHKRSPSARVVFVLAAAFLVLAMSPAGVAHADSDYRNEAAVWYPVMTTNDAHPCQGYVWIGQTWTGRIEGYSYVTCSGPQQMMWVDLKIDNDPFGYNPDAHITQKCSYSGVTWCSTSTSVSAQSGRQYCSIGDLYAWNGFIPRTGYNAACLWT